MFFKNRCCARSTVSQTVRVDFARLRPFASCTCAPFNSIANAACRSSPLCGRFRVGFSARSTVSQTLRVDFAPLRPFASCICAPFNSIANAVCRSPISLVIQWFYSQPASQPPASQPASCQPASQLPAREPASCQPASQLPASQPAEFAASRSPNRRFIEQVVDIDYPSRAP